MKAEPISPRREAPSLPYQDLLREATDPTANSPSVYSLSLAPHHGQTATLPTAGMRGAHGPRLTVTVGGS